MKLKNAILVAETVLRNYDNLSTREKVAINLAVSDKIHAAVELAKIIAKSDPDATHESFISVLAGGNSEGGDDLLNEVMVSFLIETCGLNLRRDKNG